MTKLSNEAEALLKPETVDKERLKVISLNNKLKLVKTFDEEILDKCGVDEIEESDEVNSRMEDLLRVIQKATSSKETNVVVSPVRIFPLAVYSVGKVVKSVFTVR